MGQEKEVCKLDEELQSDKLDAIFCVAGGWAGGNAANKGFHYYDILTYNARDNLAEWLQALVGQIYTDQHLACTLCRCSAFQACQKIFHLHHEEISFFSN